MQNFILKSVSGPISRAMVMQTNVTFETWTSCVLSTIGASFLRLDCDLIVIHVIKSNVCPHTLPSRQNTSTWSTTFIIPWSVGVFYEQGACNVSAKAQQIHCCLLVIFTMTINKGSTHFAPLHQLPTRTEATTTSLIALIFDRAICSGRTDLRLPYACCTDSQ